MTIEQLAEQLGPGLGVRTLRKVEQGDRDLRDLEAGAIAVACGVPEWFVREGFAAERLSTVDEVAERLERLEDLVSSQLEGAALPAPEGELRRRLEAAQPSPEDHAAPGSHPELDAPADST
jgi:hypothetical protein